MDTIPTVTFLGINGIELVAVLLGVASVWLTVKQNVWCWPIGAVMVALYVIVFGRARLYADAGLQVIYFVLQFYGWYQWLHGGEARQVLTVRRTAAELWPVLLGLAVAGTAGLGYALGRWTDQHLSYWDSGIAAFSLIAQWMMARKLLESWLIWIAVDVVAVGVYAYKALYPTAVLYTIFLALAAAGYREWRRSLAHGTDSAFPVARGRA